MSYESKADAMKANMQEMMNYDNKTTVSNTVFGFLKKWFTHLISGIVIFFKFFWYAFSYAVYRFLAWSENDETDNKEES